MKIGISSTRDVDDLVIEAALIARSLYPTRRVGIITSDRHNLTRPDTSHYLWLFANQLKMEVEYESKYGIVVTDRTLADVLVYPRSLGSHAFNYLTDYVHNVWLDTYTLIVLDDSSRAANWLDGRPNVVKRGGDLTCLLLERLSL